MQHIGFIGLGLMGRPMAKNLLKAGFQLTVHSRSRGPVDELAALGATPAASPREVAAASEVVITMVPDAPDVEAVVVGPDGILAGAKAGLIHIDMSTISPVATRRIAEMEKKAGVTHLDAPVSGGTVGAEAGTLSIMAEVLVLAAKSGLDPAKVVDVLSSGAARCWALEVRAPNILKRELNPGFKASMQYKDLNIVAETARAEGVPTPVTALVREMYSAMLVAGNGELDNSAVITVRSEEHTS